MKVLVDNDWVKRAAEIEDGCEVGAGVMHPEAPNSHAEMLSVIATQAAQIEALTKALTAMRDAGTYLLATQANKKLAETANTKFMAALDQARAALAAVGEKKP